MSYSNAVQSPNYLQQAAQAQYNNGQPAVSALEETRDKLQECHKLVSELECIADRVCGSQGAEKGSPQPVPNGMLDDILDNVSSLRQRLQMTLSRLGRI